MSGVVAVIRVELSFIVMLSHAGIRNDLGPRLLIYLIII